MTRLVLETRLLFETRLVLEVLRYLTLKVMAPVADASRRLHSYTKFEVHRPCHSEDMAHDVTHIVRHTFRMTRPMNFKLGIRM